MQIVIAGGHGQIAMLLHPPLTTRKHQVRALIRKPDHAEEVREADISGAVGHADAVNFATGTKGTAARR